MSDGCTFSPRQTPKLHYAIRFLSLCGPVETQTKHSAQVFFARLFPRENMPNRAEPQIESNGPGHCNQRNQNWSELFEVSEQIETLKKERTYKKDTFIHPAIHHNRCYGEANFHKAAKLIEADQICFTSLHSFKMAISLPISRAFTVPHSPGSG